MSHKFGTLLCFTLLFTLVGCGGDKDQDSTDKKGDAANSDAPVLAPFSTAAPLVEYDDTTADQTVDGGRMTLKLIEDWKESNDRRGNLFVFLKGGKSYPTLIVQKPEDAGDIKNLDDTTKTAYIADLTKTVIDRHGKKFVLDNPKLLDIHGHPWVLYRVTMSRSGTNEKIDGVFLTTIANGRKYTLELRASEKKGNQDWPALLTMASGITFGEKKSTEPLTPDKEPVVTEPEKAAPTENEPPTEQK